MHLIEINNRLGNVRGVLFCEPVSGSGNGHTGDGGSDLQHHRLHDRRKCTGLARDAVGRLRPLAAMLAWHYDS